ncbi:hypothetical protein HRbin37_00925 [bacterium HR37]|nr:hypothetical protein HRbin37_00925 [bacterium HR37]
MKAPSPDEFQRGYKEFQRQEKRDAMYKVVPFLAAYSWGKPAETADSLSLLLLTWNQALHRYDSFDFDRLEKCIAGNMSLLEKYRIRSILYYSPSDDHDISYLFQEFLDALKISDSKKAGTQSSVFTAKALLLLLPSYFTLWYYEIANTYGCNYPHNPAAKYLKFIGIYKQTAVIPQ